MNLEEERKAFEAALPVPTGVTWYPTHNRYFAKEPVTNAFANHANAQFVAWLAAKKHAAEMTKQAAELAKPAVYIKLGTGTYPWLVRHFDGPFAGHNIEAFPTAKKAKDWAIKAGYRVVE